MDCFIRIFDSLSLWLWCTRCGGPLFQHRESKGPKVVVAEMNSYLDCTNKVNLDGLEIHWSTTE